MAEEFRTGVVIFRDETDTDARDWCLEGDASVEEGEGTATNRGHGGRAVRLHHFRGDSQGVAEFGRRGDDGFKGAFRKGAVTDFAAILSAETAGFTHGERREVVVENESFGAFAASVGVDFLGFFQGAKGGQTNGLGFSSGEEGGTVGAG